MKYFVVSLIILGILSTPAFAELNDNDLNKIRLIVKDEVDTAIKASETRMKEYTDIKIDAFETNVNEQFKGVDEQFGHISGKINILTAVVCALIGLIGVVIALPFWKDRKDNQTLEKQVETLTQEMETLKKQIAAL